jgi:hypothetical protein
MTVVIVSVYDKDRHAIPVAAGENKQAAEEAFGDWKRANRGNDYWDLDSIEVYTVLHVKEAENT